MHPDMVMAAPVFAGGMPAMALSGEKIDGERLPGRVLDVKPKGA